MARISKHLPRPPLLLACLLVAVLLSYTPVLGAGFVWDDHRLIDDSPLVQTLHPLRDYLTQGFWHAGGFDPGRGYYRPLTTLSLALDHRVYGGAAIGFHLTNVLLHLAATVLLFRLLRVQGVGSHAALLGTALWSLHPRLSEAVAWVSGRTDVLATLFVLSALLLRARASLGGRIACGVSLFLGLLCKEVAAAGVVAVFVLELRAEGALLRRGARMLPAALALAAYALLRAEAAGLVSPEPRTLLWHAQATTAALGYYGMMLLTPWCPNLQIGRLAQPSPVFSALGVGVLVTGLWWLRRRRPKLSADQWGGAALAAVSFGLVLHVLRIKLNVVAADRFLYLPLVGLTVLLTPLLASAAAGAAGLATSAGLALALSFGIATFVRVPTWNDEIELWSTAFHESRDNRLLPCMELGRIYALSGLLPESFAMLRGCPTAQLEDGGLVNTAALVLGRAGHYREALALLQTAPEPFRRKPMYSLTRAHLEASANDFVAARAEIERALHATPRPKEVISYASGLAELARRRSELEALPSDARPAERARRFESLELTAEALDAYRSVIDSADSSQLECEQAARFAIAQGDSGSAAELYRRYRERFPGIDAQALTGSYRERRRKAERLLELWPHFGMKLVAPLTTPSH